jgi:hypothetical protein
MKVEISNGDLLDKLTILRIKQERIKDEDKLKNVEREILELTPLYQKILEKKDVTSLFEELMSVNLKIWDIEDGIRGKERNKEFDTTFISLARSVYFENDKRASIKKQINLETGSFLIEEKSYSEYK